MSSFTTPLTVTPLQDGRSWELCEAFHYCVGDKDSDECIEVPKGFVTDFASIPRFFWFLPDWATYNKSPIIHDRLYFCKEIMGNPITRKKADAVFLEAMLVDFRCHGKIGKVIAYIEWAAVRLCGWWAWNHTPKVSAKSP